VQGNDGCVRKGVGEAVQTGAGTPGGEFGSTSLVHK